MLTDLLDATAVLLAAGRGARIAAVTDEPKCLLKVGGESLLERHLTALERVGVRDLCVVVGHRADRVVDALSRARAHERFFVRLAINEDPEALGNGYSLWLGLRAAGPREVLVLDADVAYDAEVLADFARGPRDSILVGEGSLDDEECAKVLVDEADRVRLLVDKRAVTSEELATYRFAGEAVGLLRFGPATTEALAAAAAAFFDDPARLRLNWEHLLNAFLPGRDVRPRRAGQGGRWIEIDTPEDYDRACRLFAAGAAAASGARSRGWRAADVDPREVVRPLPPRARDEVRALGERLRAARSISTVRDVAAVQVDPGDFPATASEVARARDEVERGRGFTVLDLGADLGDLEVALGTWVLANLLGRPEVQNERGDTFYAVFDARRGAMRDGARYSRSRDGGSFHTDNVNLLEPLDYSVLACLAPARAGGESVLIDGLTALEVLHERDPAALQALAAPRAWEFKGIRPGQYYRAPVLKRAGHPTWRYLRDYLEEAFRARGEDVPSDLARAMDALDAVHQDPALRVVLRLERGHVLAFDDGRLFHGRLPFEDAPEGLSLDELAGPLDEFLGGGGAARLRRTMLRVYLRR